MISVTEAKDIIVQQVKSLPAKSLLLEEAHGLTLAADVVAQTDIPGYAQSSMDGYAFNFKDAGNPLKIVGEMAAGTGVQRSVGDGEATRIFTGAPLPQGADTVVMQEKIVVENGRLFIKDEALQGGSNVRPKGAEVSAGTVAMAAGTYLSAAALGFLAGIGRTDVSVYPPPTVTIILTGNELQTPGLPLAFGQVYESSSVMLTAALQKAGIKSVSILKAADDRDALSAALGKALQQSDMVLLTGGVSVGDYDFVVSTAMACGIQQHFHKIKQRPGKPLFFGMAGTKVVFGLPGNPSSSLVCFYEYVLPALNTMMQQPPGTLSLQAKLTHGYEKAKGLTHFLKGTYSNGKATPLHAQESYRMHSFAEANCLIVLPEDEETFAAGDQLTVHLL